MIVALLDEIVVDLSRAEDQLLDAVGLLAGGSFVGNDALEATALVEVLKRTSRQRMARSATRSFGSGQLLTTQLPN